MGEPPVLVPLYVAGDLDAALIGSYARAERAFVSWELAHRVHPLVGSD